ncbi:glycoside hydrolase family 13 protein [Peloplasma aerotolerans]|uniref:Alpha-glucosidase n=1 Tax=Peloplasma aerotolerans TaxID=3044389 RepID=A0AAW6UAT9_9MOLU|nr:alpha-glucosidase [Mariniplasma sp. M4Ah]MDI6453236.1 alpha-glucosidase [Mariniplasma sp. M4Ah]
MGKKWWMESIGYQIYPKSFYDSNDDGIGDLNGIYEKLDYLKDLGINLIWICPFYDSPMDDNGYDVRNFFDVSKEFGTMDDAKKLIDKAHQLGIKVILDFVLNHTSDEHPWFIESRSSVDNPYRDYYIWHEGRQQDGQKIEPTNWGSFFGGSCWKYDELTDSYYMKIFSDKMPDLNWKNEKVHEEMIQIAKKWLDQGIDGFRIDAVSHLDRAPYEDVKGSTDRYPLDWNKFSNLPKVHDYLNKLNQEVFSKYDCVTIGEVGGEASIDEGIKYASFDSNELSMVFNFDHNWCNNLHEVTSTKQLKTNVVLLKSVFNKWQKAFKDIGWLPLNWLNHDQPRLMSQYGDHLYPLASGKMLATALHMMRGTPFIYQGEEIGMTNFPFEDVSQFNDISSIHAYRYHLEKEPDDPVKALKKAALSSRDNPRTPMQWSNESYAGFSKEQPWMMVNPNYKKINVVNNLKNQDALWYHYQRLIDLRKNSTYKDLIIYGEYELLDPDDKNLYTYKRFNHQQTLLIINSFSRKKIKYDLSKYDILNKIVSNYQKHTIKNQTIYLKPYESIVFEVKEKL